MTIIQPKGTPAIQNENTSTYRNIVFIDSSSASVIKTNDNGRLQVRSSDGALRVAGDITAFYSSDRNLKENITPIPNALDKIIAISGNTFNWRSDTGFDYLDNKQDTRCISHKRLKHLDYQASQPQEIMVSKQLDMIDWFLY